MQEDSNCRVYVNKPVNPIDAGYGLISATTVLVDRSREVIIDFNSNMKLEDKLDCCILDENNKRELYKLTLLKNKEDLWTSKFLVKKLNIKNGKYKILIHIFSSFYVNCIYECEYILLLKDEIIEERTFGARYVELDYDDKVSTGNNSSKSWKDVWSHGPKLDVVIDFDQPWKLIFWRGTSYIPCWANNNILATGAYCETIESPPYADCCEPMMDRECRYSNVRIIQSSQARAIINWRYALSDFNYNICRDEWAEETYYIYPSGIASRFVNCYFDTNDKETYTISSVTGFPRPITYFESNNRRFHNSNEFIVINPKNSTCEDNIEENAFTIMDTKSFYKEINWKDPLSSFGNLPVLNDYIFLLNLKNFSTFTATPSGDVWLDLSDSNGVIGWDEKIGKWNWEQVKIQAKFSTFIHWPIRRGMGTKPLKNRKSFFKQPTHSFIGCSGNSPIWWGENGCQWNWLVGISKDKKLLRRIVSNWIYPAEVIIKNGGKFVGYSSIEMAYIIECNNKEPISIIIDTNSIIEIPVFILRGLKKNLLKITINNEKLKENEYSAGVEVLNNLRQTVLLLKDPISRSCEILIK